MGYYTRYTLLIMRRDRLIAERDKIERQIGDLYDELVELNMAKPLANP